MANFYGGSYDVTPAPAPTDTSSPAVSGLQVYQWTDGAWYDTTGKMVAAPGAAPDPGWTQIPPPPPPTASWRDPTGGNPSGVLAPQAAQQQATDAYVKSSTSSPLDAALGYNPIAAVGQAYADNNPLVKPIDAGITNVATGGSLLGTLGGLTGLGGSSTIGSGTLSSDLQNTRDTRTSFQQQLADYQPRTAPQITASSPGAANTISAPTLGSAQQATASTVGPVERVGASNISAPTLGSAAQVSAPTLGTARSYSPSTMQAAQVGPTDKATMQTYGGATVNVADEAAMRARQTQLLDQLQAYANGTGGPSAAEILLQQQTERNLAQQYALSQTARGSNIGAAQRQASLTAGDLNAQAAAQGAALRAQEQATARQQYTGALSDVRGADLGLATTQAGLNQQAGLANQSAFNTLSQFNAGQTNASRLAQAQLTQGANQFNAGATNEAAQFGASSSNDFAKTQAAMALQAGLANQSATNQFSLTGADMALKASLANQSTDMQAALANQSAYNQSQQFNATQTQQAALANQAAGNQFTLQQGQMDLQSSLANQQALNQFQLDTAQLGQQAALANLDASLKAQGLDDQMRQAYMQQIVGLSGQVIQGDVGAMQAQAAATGAKLQFASGLAGALATMA